MQKERSYFFLLKVMGRVSQNYSRGKHSPSFTGKSNHPKQGGGEGKEIAQVKKRRVQLWRAGKKEEWGGKDDGDGGSEEERVSVTFFLSDVPSHSLIYNKQLKATKTMHGRRLKDYKANMLCFSYCTIHVGFIGCWLFFVFFFCFLKNTQSRLSQFLLKFYTPMNPKVVFTPAWRYCLPCYIKKNKGHLASGDKNWRKWLIFS